MKFNHADVTHITNVIATEIFYLQSNRTLIKRKNIFWMMEISFQNNNNKFTVEASRYFLNYWFLNISFIRIFWI